MKNLRRLTTSLLSLLLALTVLAGTVQAALLDVGANVPRVFGSTPPNLGHGFPLWYRDSNRVPLELCTDEAMCLFLRPNIAQPIRFPDNMPDEVFFYSAEAIMPTSGGTSLLFAAVEGNIVPELNGDTTLVSFARVRIRIDTNVAGDYLVTTPFKQYTFKNVPVGARAINFTEDIGLGADGVFTGALSGNIGPFVYSQGAPFTTATGSYIGDNTPRLLRGSTFTDPLTGQPANVFRIEGPTGFATVSTNLFAVTGKIYTQVTPTPLEVEKATYTRSADGVQLKAFATSQPLANQTNPAAPFPLNFALTGALTALELAGSNLPTLGMTTNNPADGKFFSNSGLLASSVALPATVTVTNTADIPPVVLVVPLVDDVVVNSATFDAATSTLQVSALSLDTVANPELSVYMPGMAEPLGKLDKGNLSVTFPFTDTKVNPAKTYNIPPEKVTVLSALGGSDSRAVSSVAPLGAPQGSIVINGGAATTDKSQVTLTMTATSPNGPITQMSFSKDGSQFFPFEPFATSKPATLLPGDGERTIYVRFKDAAGKLSAIFSDKITVAQPAPGSVLINAGANTTDSAGVNLTLTAGGTSAAVTQMQFSKDGVTFTPFEPFVATRTVTLLPGNGERSIYVRYKDSAGNLSAIYSDSITVAGFGGAVAINGGADFTNSASAALTLSVTNASGVVQMQFSKDGVNYFAYEPFSDSRKVTFSAGDGVKTIWVRFKDGAGKISQASDSITLDSTSPTGTIAFSTASPTSSATGVLALSASDANGATQMQLAKNGGAFFAWEPFAASRTVTLATGLNTLTVRYRDAAGNISAPVSATITRN